MDSHSNIAIMNNAIKWIFPFVTYINHDKVNSNAMNDTWVARINCGLAPGWNILFQRPEKKLVIMIKSKISRYM